MKYFPRTHYIGTAPRDSDKKDNKRNQTGRIWRLDRWFLELKESQSLEKQISEGTFVFFGPATEEDGVERTIAILKDSGTPVLCRAGNRPG